MCWLVRTFYRLLLSNARSHKLLCMDGIGHCLYAWTLMYIILYPHLSIFLYFVHWCLFKIFTGCRFGVTNDHYCVDRGNWTFRHRPFRALALRCDGQWRLQRHRRRRHASFISTRCGTINWSNTTVNGADSGKESSWLFAVNVLIRRCFNVTVSQAANNVGPCCRPMPRRRLVPWCQLVAAPSVEAPPTSFTNKSPVTLRDGVSSICRCIPEEKIAMTSCVVCSNLISARKRRALECDLCGGWCHLKCQSGELIRC